MIVRDDQPKPGNETPAAPVAILTGWSLVAAFAVTATAVHHIAANVRLFQTAYLVGFVGYAVLVFLACRRSSLGHWGYWVAGAIALRVVLVQTTPSDDLYRYVWEGRVQAAGFNPYVTAPDDSALKSFRDDVWQGINHKDYPAIYPPLAQWQFRAAVALNPTVQVTKWMYVVFDSLAVVLLAFWLIAERKSPHLAIVYGLSPLVLTAVGIEGHLDGALIAFLAAAGWSDAKHRPYLSAVFLAAAILTKIVPIILLPWLARKCWPAAILAVTLIVLGYIPFVSPEASLFHSLVKFPRETEMLSLGHGVIMKRLDPDASRFLCAAIVAVIAIWHARKPAPLSQILLPVFGAFIIFMPIVHFWYLTWIALAVAVKPRASWLVLTASMVFYFESTLVAAQTGTWAMPTWVPYPVYIPFLIAAIVEWRIRPRRLLR